MLVHKERINRGKYRDRPLHVTYKVHWFYRVRALLARLCFFAAPYRGQIRFLFFKCMQPLTVQLLYTVKEKGGKPDRKPYPLPYGLKNPYRNLKSENSQDYAQKPQQNCTFMNSSSGLYTVQYTLCRLLYGMIQ